MKNEHVVFGKTLSMLSVIIPVYNEKKTIHEVLDRVKAVPVDKEIIVVDDASTDGSWEEIGKVKGITALAHSQNRGKGAAIRTGLAKVRGDLVIIQDADMEYDPRDYLVLIEAMKHGGGDVVYGSRILGERKGLNEGRSSQWFYWGGRLVSLWASLLFGYRLTDEATCYKMFRRKVLESITLESDGFEICAELTAKVFKKGYRITEVPIRYKPRNRREGKKIRWTDGVKAMWTLAKYRVFK